METRFRKCAENFLRVAAVPLLLFGAFIAVVAMVASGPFPDRKTKAGPDNVSPQSFARYSAIQSGDELPAAPDVAPKARCATCGVIESVREVQESGAPADVGRFLPISSRIGSRSSDNAIARASTIAVDQDQTRGENIRKYEITVRMKDGSARILRERDTASWKVGKKVILIDGE